MKADAAAGAPACSTAVWSRPEILRTADSNYAYLGFPEAVWTTRSTLLFGGEPILWRVQGGEYEVVAGWPPPHLLSGFARTAHGVQVIPLPDGSKSFRAPRAFVQSTGSIRVVWADTAQRGNNAADLWTAAYGESWSKPQPIRIGRSVVWNPVSTSIARAPDRGAVLVIPSRMDTTYVVGLDERGTVSLMSRVPVGAVYAQISDLKSRNLVLAYIGARSSPGIKDHNSVFVTRAGSAAGPWSDAARLYRSGEGDQAHWLQLLTATDDVLYLVWGQLFRDGPDSLMSLISRDQGQSWRRLPSLGFARGIEALAATLDGLGRIHAVVVSAAAPPDNTEIIFLEWRDPAWSRGPVHPQGVTSISLNRLTADTLLATWTQLHRVGEQDLPVTVVSSLSLCEAAEGGRTR